MIPSASVFVRRHSAALSPQCLLGTHHLAYRSFASSSETLLQKHTQSDNYSLAEIKNGIATLKDNISGAANKIYELSQGATLLLNHKAFFQHSNLDTLTSEERALREEYITTLIGESIRLLQSPQFAQLLKSTATDRTKEERQNLEQLLFILSGTSASRIYAPELFEAALPFVRQALELRKPPLPMHHVGRTAISYLRQSPDLFGLSELLLARLQESLRHELSHASALSEAAELLCKSRDLSPGLLRHFTRPAPVFPMLSALWGTVQVPGALPAHTPVFASGLDWLNQLAEAETTVARALAQLLTSRTPLSSMQQAIASSASNGTPPHLEQLTRMKQIPTAGYLSALHLGLTSVQASVQPTVHADKTSTYSVPLHPVLYKHVKQWRDAATKQRMPSLLQEEVRQALWTLSNASGIPRPKCEFGLKKWGLSLDFAWEFSPQEAQLHGVQGVGLEVAGPSHFVFNASTGASSGGSGDVAPTALDAPTLFKYTCLERMGWQIVHVPYTEWPSAATMTEPLLLDQLRYLQDRLKYTPVTSLLQ